MIGLVNHRAAATKTAAAAQARRAEIASEIEALQARLLEKRSALHRDAGRAALAGRELSAETTARRRAEIAAAKERLEALQSALPLAERAVKAADEALLAAIRQASADAVPALHKRRVEEAKKLAPLISKLIEQLAAVKAIDLVQDHFAGLEPFVRQLPSEFYFATPLVDRLVTAIAPQFLNDQLLKKRMDDKAKALAANEIAHMEKVYG